MMTRSELEELSSYRVDSQPVVSFYLAIEKGEPDEDQYAIRLKNLINRAQAQKQRWSGAQARSIDKDLNQIQRLVTEERVRGTKSLAVFASNISGLWQLYRLSLPVRNRLVIAPSPYVKPLIRLFESSGPYCTVLIEKGRARIFVLRLGEVEERTDVFGVVPGRHDQGGWAQARLQRHHDEHVMRHLKSTAEQLFTLHREEEFSGLLIGGTDELVSQFQDHLHPYLRDRTLATFPMDITANAKEVREQSWSTINRLEEEETERLVERLKGEVQRGNLGAIGLSDTLHVLQNGQIMTLLVDRGLQARGSRCGQCGALTIEIEGRCRYCEGELEPVADIVDEIVEEAFNQGCKIKFLAEGGALAEMGGVGALLRFP